MNETEVSAHGVPTVPGYTVWQMTAYALKLGSIGFGGPVALVGYMHRDLVEQRGWLTEEDYKEGLTLAQLAPGPLAAQLAIYLGYCHYGVPGATLVGVAFALPSFLMVVALGWGYVLLGGMAWMQAVFYAVGASIIGIIARSAQRLTTRTVGRDPLLWIVYGVLAVDTVLTEEERIPFIVLGGLAAWLARQPPRVLRERQALRRAAFGAVVLLGSYVSLRYGNVLFGMAAVEERASRVTGAALLWEIFAFFGKAGAFVFGSGLAIVPFLFGGVVKGHQWLNDHQFIDAVAVAMITPGPVVITTGFIGYLVAELPGACVAAFATFFPCYLFTIIPAPFMRRHGKAPAIAAAVDGVTAAATGAIAGAVIVLGRRSIVDWPTALIALLTYGVLWRTRKVPEPVLIVIAAAVGMLVYRG